MSEALFTFSRIMAVGVIVWCSFVVFGVTYSRAQLTEAQQMLQELKGHKFRSRGKSVLAILVAATWLYCSWGVAP